jgi:hypothetical protein
MDVLRNLGSVSSGEEHTMTTVQINLPDGLAQKAASAGLLSAEPLRLVLDTNVVVAGLCGVGRPGA